MSENPDDVVPAEPIFENGRIVGWRLLEDMFRAPSRLRLERARLPAKAKLAKVRMVGGISVRGE